MSFNEVAERKDGSKVNVIAETKEDLSAAVKAAKEANPVSKININRPTTEGHDLVVVNPDGSSELSNVLPDDALNAYDGNRDLDQRAAEAIEEGVTGSTENSAAAKRAAELKADEALALRGPSTESELQEAKSETKKSK